MENARKGRKAFLKTWVFSKFQIIKKSLQVKVDSPAAINKKKKLQKLLGLKKKIHWMTLRPTVKYGGGSIMDWDCIFTSEATIKAQL